MGNNIWNKNDFCRYIRGEKFKIFRSFKYFCRCTKWSCQRITRGYADCDWWDMDSYLQQLIPDMLKALKKNRHGSPAYLGETYADKNGCTANDSCHDAWDQILDRMIFLWEESDETICSQKNKWEEEHALASEEFSEKYGIFGEKLESENDDTDKRSHRIHFMDELPEYKEISEKYWEENNRLDKYRKDCRDEAIDLLKEHFSSLWD